MSKNSEVRNKALASIETLREAIPPQGETQTKAEEVQVKYQGLAERVEDFIRDLGIFKKDVEGLQDPLAASKETISDTLADVRDYGDTGRNFRSAQNQLNGSEGSLTSASGILDGVTTEMDTLSATLASVQKRMENGSAGLGQIKELTGNSVDQTNGAIESLENWIQVSASDD